ncbi:MAG TPA: zinc ABC transporter substrate-binding protein [Candidatus Dormibacteraeota bacterium]|nr:zinc ABC transporter substrate-binding protein [Candidatus Dormibacteraeota bacterium]
MRKAAVVLGSILLIVASAACGTGSTTAHAGSLNVIAGENFWGSIAIQLGGSRVNVQSVVTDPNADPHEYESSTNDARAFAQADLVILNGAGYDVWGQKLLDANASSHRKVLIVADVLGKKQGDNPHFWYDPATVVKVADAITARYRSLDSGDASFFDQRRTDFTAALQPYFTRIAEIKQKFAGVQAGSTESIFVYMASALGLDLISPPEFMTAVSEGNDPPAAAVIEFQNQISGKQIKVLVYNAQTATAVTTNIKHMAQAADIPIVGVSETLQPETVTFQDWQLAQLIALENALNAAVLVK